MHNGRRPLVAILLGALTVVAAATPAAAQLSVTLNQTAFRPGEAFVVTLRVQHGGQTFLADGYAGVILPNGTAEFLSPSGIVITTLAANPASFPPLVTDVVIPSGLDTTLSNFISSPPLSAQLPRGEYGVFAALVRANALQDGQINAGDIVAATLESFVLADVGTGLTTAAIEIMPPSPTPNDSVSVRLSGTWPDSCVPGLLRVRVTGSEIRIDTVGALPGTGCAQVLTPWQLTAPVGRLAAGVYRVVVINTSHGQVLDLGRQTFQIQ